MSEHIIAKAKAPWTFRELSGDDSRGMGYVNDGSEDIAHVGVMGYSTRQNLELAHLIAAAPELLAALKDVTARFERCMIVNGTDEEFARIATEQFRAAIAAAEPAEVAG